MENKTKNTGFLISTIAFCVVAITALPLRTYQFFTVLEPETGFFSSINWSVYALYAILAAGLLISLIAALIYKSELGFDRKPEKRRVQGIIAIVAAVSVLYETAVTLNSLLTAISSNDAELTKPALVVLVAQAIFGVFAAIYFVVFGMSVISGATNASEYKILSLAPAVWCMFRLVYRFMRTISFVRVSDLLLELFMLALMLMFFLAFAQLNSKIDSKGVDWKLVGYGLPAALMALICFIPRLVVVVTGNSDILYAHSPVEYCDLGTALFVLSVVFTRIGWVGGNADAKDEAAAKAVADAEAAVQATQESAE